MLVNFPRTFLPALAVGTALLVAGCGDSANDNAGGAAKAGNPVDRAFVAQMIPHHESAVQMAKIAQRRGSSEFVKDLADDIVRTQAAEISTMRAADERLEAIGVKLGSLGVSDDGTEHDSGRLKTAEPFDRAFLQMMLPHHEAAIPMSRAQIARGGDAQLKRLAQEIIAAQQREISAMRDHLGTAGSATEDTDAAHGAGHSG